MKPNLKLKCLICIVNHDFEDSLLECLRENGARGINVTLGHGAKKFHLLEYEHTHKSVVLAFIKSENEKDILQMLVSQDLAGNKNGIAFTIDVDAAAGGNSIFSFYDKIQKHFKEKGGFEAVLKEINAENYDNAAIDKTVNDNTIDGLKLNPGESEK